MNIGGSTSLRKIFSAKLPKFSTKLPKTAKSARKSLVLNFRSKVPFHWPFRIFQGSRPKSLVLNILAGHTGLKIADFGLS